MLDGKRKSTSYVTVDVTRGTYKTLGGSDQPLGRVAMGARDCGSEDAGSQVRPLGG